MEQGVTTGITVEFGGELWAMHADGSLLHSASNTLILADLHIGKVTHFRRAGIAIPNAARSATADRLDACLQQHQPDRVVIAGDLFHSDANSETHQFIQELPQWGRVEWVWITGNHDRATSSRYAHLFHQTAPEIFIGSTRITHESQRAKTPTISAHLHPVILVQHGARLKTKHRCFAMEKHDFRLPAFGRFTGGFRIQPQPTGRYFILTDKAVYEL